MLDGAPGFVGAEAAADLARKKGGGTTVGSVGSARGAAAYVTSMYAAGGIRVFYRGCLVVTPPRTMLVLQIYETVVEIV